MATDGTLGRQGEPALAATSRWAPISASSVAATCSTASSKFDVETGGRVTFTGPDGVKNVIGRVTGGEPSSIDGTLASTIPGADLYLINPAGILFGPNARLDVKGSFHASTADELRFADGAVFSALDPPAAGSRVADAAGVRLPGQQCRSARDRGQRSGGPTGATLDFVAGEVAIDGATLGISSAPVSQTASAVSIAAQKSAGVVPLDPSSPAVARDGPVRIGLGEQGNPSLLFVFDPNGGRITIGAGDLVIDGANLFAVSGGPSNAVGGIDVAAQTLSLEARQGDLGTALLTSSGGTSAAGPVRLSIANSLDILSGVVASSPIGEGGAGPVTVTTDRLTMNSGVIGTPAGRQTGNVPVRGASNATNVVANSSILLTNGALILSSSFGDADAGPLTVTSQGSITISDGAPHQRQHLRRRQGRRHEPSVRARDQPQQSSGLIEGSSFGYRCRRADRSRGR